MRTALLNILLACGLLTPAVPSDAAAEVVVAIRYLQAKGESHSHLYLYREDGRLLRQLTKDDSGQEYDPIFAPDGATIVFRRVMSEGMDEYWSVEPSGNNLHLLEGPPEWYTNTKSSPFYTNYEPEPEGTPAPTATPADVEEDPPRTYRAPDDSVEVVVQRLSTDEDDSVNCEGTGKHFLLRDLQSGKEKEMGTLPGFLGLWDVLHLKGQPENVFLLHPSLRVVFFGLHLNSTDGDTVFALDLKKSELKRLSPNWAVPIPLPDEPAFLTLTYNRYVPIPGSKKTANCSYLERWDARLKKVRYARAGTAAICYGASIYRPDRTPATVHLRYVPD